MWLTTKKLVREMLEEQKRQMDQIASLEQLVQELSSNVRTSSKNLSENITILEDKTMGICSNMHEKNELLIREMKEIILSGQREIIGAMETSANELRNFIEAYLTEKQDELHSFINEENAKTIDIIIEKINLQKIHYDEIKADIEKLLSEQCNAVLLGVDKLNEEFNTAISEKTQQVVSAMSESIMTENEKISQLITSEKVEMLTRINDISEDYSMMQGNIAQVDVSLKQVVDYLLSLDDANRLIIAKLLLREI